MSAKANVHKLGTNTWKSKSHSRKAEKDAKSHCATDPSPACGPKPMLFTARRFPFGGRRPVPLRPAPDGAGLRLVKAPVAGHPLPKGEGKM